MLTRLLLLITLIAASSAGLFAQTNPCGTAPHCVVLNWSWTQGTGGAATGFNIKRSTTSGTEVTIASLTGIATLTYTDLSTTANPLPENQRFFYEITATGPGGESTPSNEVVVLIPSTVPVPPTGLGATAH